jgi:hypothetical protein
MTRKEKALLYTTVGVLQLLGWMVVAAWLWALLS